MKLLFLLSIVIESALFASCQFPESTLPTRPFVAEGYARSILDPSLCPPLITSGSGSGTSSSGPGSGTSSSGSGSGTSSSGSGSGSASGSGTSSSGSGIPSCLDPRDLLCPICSLCVVSLVYNEDICSLCESVSCDNDYDSSGSGSTSFVPSVSSSDFGMDQCPVLLRSYRQVCQAGNVISGCDYPTYLANFCDIVIEVCEDNLSPAPASGSGVDCERPVGHGLFCQSVTANSSCLFAYSEPICSDCSVFLDDCDPVDTDLTTVCTDPSTTSQCNTSSNYLCFSATRPSDTCDYCAYIGNECFSDSQEQLCTINSLVEGCSQTFDTDYPCECFFPSGQCQLCETVLRVCEIPTTEIPTTEIPTVTSGSDATSGPTTLFTTPSETTSIAQTNGTAATSVASTTLGPTLSVTTESTLPVSSCTIICAW